MATEPQKELTAPQKTEQYLFPALTTAQVSDVKQMARRTCADCVDSSRLFGSAACSFKMQKLTSAGRAQVRATELNFCVKTDTKYLHFIFLPVHKG